MPSPARFVLVLFACLAAAGCSNTQTLTHTPAAPAPASSGDPAASGVPTDSPAIGDGGTHSITAPATLGGQPRMSMPALDSEAQTIKQQAGSAIRGLFYAAYGSGAPKYMLVGVTLSADTGASTIDPTLLQEFTAGFQSQSGQALSPSDAVTETAGGNDYTCFNVQESGVPFGLCMWLDGNVLGMLLEPNASSLSGVAADTGAARAVAEK